MFFAEQAGDEAGTRDHRRESAHEGKLRWTQAKRPDLICVRYEGPIDFFYQSF